jgi:hypothetical protein
MQDLIESNGKLVSKIESEKCEIQKQVEELQQMFWKTETELLLCKKDFCEYRVQTRKAEDTYLGDIVDRDNQLKEFRNVVYKHGNSITTIQKFTLKPRLDKGFAIGDFKSMFLHKALKENPKIYSMEHMLDDSIVRTVL